jgi:hypothetical protein
MKVICTAGVNINYSEMQHLLEIASQFPQVRPSSSLWF